jgi:hypothetical protein
VSLNGWQFVAVLTALLFVFFGSWVLIARSRRGVTS